MGQAPIGVSYNTAGDGVPLIAGAGDFSDGELAIKKFTTAPTRLSRGGDVVLSIRASIGDKVIADGTYCLGRGVAGLRAKSPLNERYLWHWLTAAAPALQAKGRGATFLQVNRSDIAELAIPLPPIQEQSRIAVILDQADALRVNRLEVLALVDSLTKSIFLDMFGHPANDSGRWPSTLLESVVKTSSGSTPDRSCAEYFNGPIPWVKSGELLTDLVTETEETLTSDGLASCAAKLLPRGTILMAMYGATAGVVSQLGLEAATNQAVCAISPSGQVDPQFLIVLLQLLAPRLVAQRVGGAQPNLTQGLIRKLPVQLPPLELQQSFAQRITRVASQRSVVRRSAERLDELFASLQHRAFRGEL